MSIIRTISDQYTRKARRRRKIDKFFHNLTIILLIGLLMVAIAFFIKVMEPDPVTENWEKIKINYSSCGGKDVIYDEDTNPYIWKGTRKIFLMKEGCKYGNNKGRR